MKALGFIVMTLFLLFVGLALFSAPSHEPKDTTPVHVGDNVRLKHDTTWGCPSPFEINGVSSYIVLMRAQPGPRKSDGTLIDEFVAHRRKVCYQLDGDQLGKIDDINSDGGSEAFRIHLKERDLSLWFDRDGFKVMEKL